MTEYWTITDKIKNILTTDVCVIAGDGTSVPLRDLKRLYYTHRSAGSAKKWQKKVGTVKGDNFLYEIHWYSNGSYVPLDDIKTVRVRKWKIKCKLNI